MFAKKFALAFGIAILLPFLVHSGVCTFSPEPKWTYQNYQAYDNTMSKEEQAQIRKKNEEHQQDYNKQRKLFQRHLFYVAAPVGFIALVVGAFLSVPAVGTGLMFGGVITLIEGITCYWSEINDITKFIILLITFVVLIWIGYGKLSSKNEK